MVEVKIKKVNDDAIAPYKATEYSAGFDLYATNTEVIGAHKTKMFHTGWAFEIPEGYVGKIYARSSLSTKKGLRPATCVSIIDSDYRGEVTVPIHNDTDDKMIGIEKGDRIAQIIFEQVPIVKIVQVGHLSKTERGEGGYGSTGK